MLRMILLAVGACVIVLTISFMWKAYERLILWLSAIFIFAGTLLSIGLGWINPFNGENGDSTPFWGTVTMLIISAALAICAEIQKDKNKEKINHEQISNTNETSVLNEQPADNNEMVVLPKVLDTELAREVFAKALEADFMKQEGSHYKWKKSKVLLAYMCGRIYCGDKSKFDEVDRVTLWECDKTVSFPDKELNLLFQTKKLSQSRRNRKDAVAPDDFEQIDKFFE